MRHDDTRPMDSTARLNDLDAEAAAAALRQCCGATRWVAAMAQGRPFADADAVIARADAAWAACEEDDWLEAFRAHPRIGERKAHTDTGAVSARWSAQEQAGMDGSGGDVRAALAEVNAAYEAKYGFIYIVCATGLSPEALLDLARRRMDSTRDAELRTAAAEQHKILRLRLEKLLRP
jgi:2-oxo-4-hydroxy-4-carboxy-5-ureidoimidazoline decarboxylase